MSPQTLMLIPKAYQDACNKAALQWDPIGGVRTFTVGLSVTGFAPATHYWASALVSEKTYGEIEALWKAKYPLARLEAWDRDKEPGLPDKLLKEMGLQRMDKVKSDAV